METVKVSSKGQIVIPKALREAQRICPGTRFTICAVGDELRLTPAPLFAATRVEDGLGILARKGVKAMRDEDMNAAVRARAKARDDGTKAR